MEVPMIKYMLFRHTTIPTTALPAANSLPNPNPFVFIQNWLENAVILVVLKHKTMTIDRLMAEDFAEAFQIGIEEIPDDIEDMLEFVRQYIVKNLAEGSMSKLTAKLQYAVHRLNQIILSIDGEMNDGP
jgi:hypothetical protein